MLNLIISHCLKTSVHWRHLRWDTTICSKQKSSGLSRLNYAFSAQFCMKSRYYYANGISVSGGTHWMVGWEIRQQGSWFLFHASWMGWYAWRRQELARIVRKVGFAVLVHACPVIVLCYQVLIISWCNPSFQVVWKPENKWRRSWYSGLVGVAT